MYLNGNGITFEKSHVTKANFTNFEKEFIADLVMKYSLVLENRRNDAAMSREKSVTWEFLAEEFNNYDPKITKRTAKQLKKCWENLKTRAKKASFGLKPDQPFHVDDRTCETLVDNQPQVADLIALQLKPISLSDVIKPIDEDSRDKADSTNDQTTSSNDSISTEKEPTTSAIQKTSPALTSLIKIPMPVPILPKPTVSTTNIPASASICTTPTTHQTAIKNPLLRQKLEIHYQGKHLLDEEQRLKVHLLKRKLEMVEEEHSETMALLRAKRQYVELKKQQLLKEDSTNV